MIVIFLSDFVAEISKLIFFDFLFGLRIEHFEVRTAIVVRR